MRDRFCLRLVLSIYFLCFLLIISQPTPVEGANNAVEESYSLLQKHYVEPVPATLASSNTVTDLLKALGDPYAHYYTKEEFKKAMELLNGSFTGVGIVFSPGKEGATILQLLPGSPAAEAGLKEDDLVVEASGQSLAGLNEDRVADIIRGPVGSTVMVKIKRSGQVLEFKLTRKELNLPTVQGVMLGQDTGLLELYEFGANSTPEMAVAIQKLKAEQTDRWILDMRDNPGGFLDTALGVAGFFIGKADTVMVKDRSGQEVYPGELNNQYIEGPLIVLVNENSASAAEIITAALKDQGRALIMGHTTYGKGTVQQVFDLSNGDVIKFTVARFYSPLGHPINGLGIEPDIPVSETQALKAAQLLLTDIPASYSGRLIKIDTDKFSIGVDPVIARRGEYWPAWTEIIKGCASYPIYSGNDKMGWTKLSPEQRTDPWMLYYPDSQYQGELTYKADSPGGLTVDFLSDVKTSYLNDTNIQVIKAATGERIPVKFNCSNGNKVSLTPIKALEPCEYWLTVDNTFLRFNDGHKLDKSLIARIMVTS